MSEALAVIRDIYAAFGRGDAARIIGHLAPDVEWEHGATDHGIPWLRPGRGHAHVQAFLATVAEELDIRVFEVQAPFVNGRELLVPIRIELVTRRHGKAVRDLELHHWVLGEAGTVVRFRHVVDTHAHWLAAR